MSELNALSADYLDDQVKSALGTSKPKSQAVAPVSDFDVSKSYGTPEAPRDINIKGKLCLKIKHK